eukprot:3140342-Prorocentrum_lima.AAC.1
MHPLPFKAKLMYSIPKRSRIYIEGALRNKKEKKLYIVEAIPHCQPSAEMQLIMLSMRYRKLVLHSSIRVLNFR